MALEKCEVSGARFGLTEDRGARPNQYSFISARAGECQECQHDLPPFNVLALRRCPLGYIHDGAAENER